MLIGGHARAHHRSRPRSSPTEKDSFRETRRSRRRSGSHRFPGARDSTHRSVPAWLNVPCQRVCAVGVKRNKRERCDPSKPAHPPACHASERCARLNTPMYYYRGRSGSSHPTHDLKLLTDERCIIFHPEFIFVHSILLYTSTGTCIFYQLKGEFPHQVLLHFRCTDFLCPDFLFIIFPKFVFRLFCYRIDVPFCISRLVHSCTLPENRYIQTIDYFPYASSDA
jgi:hypothetical protein